VSDDRISTYQSQIQITQKKIQICRKCGLPRKGHQCKGKMVKLIQKNTKCPVCHKPKKGHVCKALKKNLDLLNKIHQFFKDLF
jgi:rubrerythrin